MRTHPPLCHLAQDLQRRGCLQACIPARKISLFLNARYHYSCTQEIVDPARKISSFLHATNRSSCTQEIVVALEWLLPSPEETVSSICLLLKSFIKAGWRTFLLLGKRKRFRSMSCTSKIIQLKAEYLRSCLEWKNCVADNKCSVLQGWTQSFWPVTLLPPSVLPLGVTLLHSDCTSNVHPFSVTLLPLSVTLLPLGVTLLPLRVTLVPLGVTLLPLSEHYFLLVWHYFLIV